MFEEITPSESYSRLMQGDRDFLIDVRTKPEWAYVGTVDLYNAKNSVIYCSLYEYPTMELNKNFFDLFSNNNLLKNDHLHFICKIGGRSAQAALAATELGYINCYNIIGGFEGDIDELGHRGNINGWKYAQLPWRQS